MFPLRLHTTINKSATVRFPADVDTEGEYYNVEGTVGSRIAQQLQHGDRIRIGINGNVQTHDLKVKKWHREDSYM